MNDGNSGTGAFVTGFLLGVLVGALAALLMTPQSGETTRLQLRETGIELKTQVEEKLPTRLATSTKEEAETASEDKDTETAEGSAA